ncbi:MAG: response regulator [Aggregatilineales bacterium]
MVMIALPTKLLLLAADPQPLADALNANPGAYDVTVIGKTAAAMETLRDSNYDVIVLDDALFGAETLRAVREIRRRHPITPLVVATASDETGYHTDLLEAGAADVFDDSLYQGELHRRLRLVMQQRRQNLAMARRNSNLETLVTLARRFHAATDPRSLLVEAIDAACRMFGLYGMAVALREGDMLHIFAECEGAATGTIFESSLRPHMYDPFMRVIETGFAEFFQNIQQDDYYTKIAALPSAESAIVLPLAYPDYALGALAVFGRASAPVSRDDLITYELLAAQLTTAYQNALHYAEQEKRVKFSAHLLKAWQRFVSLDSPGEIAAVLREMIEDIPSVNQALVWLYQDDVADRLIVRASSVELADTFCELHQRGHIASAIEQMDDHMQVTLQLGGRGHQDPLGPLFRGLRGQQLMLFPVTDSARIAGGVLASAVGSGQFAIEDANLMKSLAHAAGQALVRTMLTNVMTEKGGRLEAILRSIYEGIVFVDNTGWVAFANTQFTELTAVNPADILNRESEALFERLAAQSVDPDKTHRQLRAAVASVLEDDGADENYPILEISLAGHGREINVEFARITGTIDNAYLGWISIARDSSHFKNLFSAQMSLFDIMSERIRLPHAELRGLVTTLVESHNRLNNSERARFLRRVEKNVEAMGELWENLLDIYHLELTGLALEREESDLYDILQRALKSRIFSENRRQFQVDAPAHRPPVRVDELRMERAFSNVLQSALALTPPGAPVKLRLESRGRELRVNIHAQGTAVSQSDIERLFDPLYQFNDDSTMSGLGLGLYLSRELIERHGGCILAECPPGKGTLFTIVLPAADGASLTVSDTAPAALVERAASGEVRTTGYSVQKRQPKAIMVIEGKSTLVGVLRAKLDALGYETLVYRSSEEALRDVNAVRLDLIVLDVNLPDANSLDMCDRLRKRTEVPIIMLADEASAAEEVRALKQSGADAFITPPISEEQLLARVDVILKRVADLPTRTREPLDLGDLVIDFARREVYLNNKPVELTRIEYDLLNVLVLNENQVLTHKQLLDKVWGPEYQAETQYLWVNISRLRKKLEPTPYSLRYIHTQQGVGYVFRRP